jgi:hypothetical protein
MALMIGALLVGCLGAGNKVPETRVALPQHIQEMEDAANKIGPHSVRVVEYLEYDTVTFIFVDNSSVPGKCDYVLIIETLNEAKTRFRSLDIINYSNSPNPCFDGKEYFEVVKARMQATKSKRDAQRKEGI